MSDVVRIYGDIRLFAGSSHPALAEEVGNYLGVPLSPREIIRFPNDNIFVRLLTSVRGQDVFLIQTLTAPVSHHIMEMLILIDTIKRANVGRITAVMPYYAYGRSDKKDQPRVPITARLLADLVKAAGADRFLTLDLHAGQIQGFFNIPGDEVSTFHLLSDYMIEKRLGQSPGGAVVVTADLGYAKKGRNFAQALNLPMAFIEKRRSGNDAKAQALTVIGDVAGKAVILVDDEVDTAGSMLGAVNILKQSGAGDVYLCFTHPILSPPAVERLRSLPLKEIITTNSVPIPEEKMLPNLTQLSVAPLLGEVIRRIHEGQSVGAIFNE
ncbi:MAG: ribose-phosphate pyrophosphokinase [Thermoflexales bacterium]|nr:ribose-phosphate pyrophosphokinase [Thermoflexales bacterium]